MLEGFLVEGFYNASINSETEDQPTNMLQPRPPQAVFTLLYHMRLFSLNLRYE